MRITSLALVGLFGAAPLAAQAPSDIEISPPQVQLKLGDKTKVAATGFTDTGDIVQKVAFRWSTTDTSVVRVVTDSLSPDVGTLVPVAPGAAVVEARSGRARGFTTVEVAGTAVAVAAVAENVATTEARKRVTSCSLLLRPPAACSWAEWQTDKGSLKLALLGTEPAQGKNFYRFEMASTPRATEQGTTVIQLLTPSWPNTGNGLSELIIQAKGRPPMRISGERLASMRPQMTANTARVAAGECKNMTDLGSETVTVPAGKFTARHFRDEEGNYEAWFDPSVPFGVVKAVGKNGNEIVLASKGTGATTAIVGTPKDMPGGGRQMRPRGRRS